MFVLTLLCALGSGLMAGVFFAFSAFVMKALARLPPAQGIAAMQAINVAVLNPVFLAVFLGTAAACVALAACSLSSWREPGSIFRLSGCALYVVGTFLVTIAFNVPRNNALAAVDPAKGVPAGLWERYLSGWTTWNHVRAAAALAAAASLTLSLRH